MGMRKRDYGNNGSGKGVSSPPLRRHRLYAEHAGDGGGYGDDYFQDGFQGVFTYFHDVCVFSSFRPFPTVQQRGRPAGVAVPDLRAFGQACRSLAAAGTRDGKMVNKKNTCVCCVCVCRRPTVRGSRRSRDIAWPTRQAPPCRCRRGRG